MAKRRFFVSSAVVLIATLASAPLISPAGPFQFFSVTPCRIVDTRNPNGPTGGPALTSGVGRTFQINGLCSVPSTAQAVALNVTITQPGADGFLLIYPAGGMVPLVSTINFVAGEPALANGAIVPVTTPGTNNLTIIYGTGGGPPTTVHVILDVTGYFQ